MKKLIVALIASVAAMSAAQAQQTAPRAYVGVGVASADHDYRISGASNVDTDGYKASGKLFGGYEFNQTWGVEAGYTDFRKSGVNYTANGVNQRGETKGESIYLAAKATMPVNEQFSVYGKLGAARNKSELVAINSSQNRDHSKTEAYGALGAQYNLNQNVALIAEYERYGKSKDFGAKADVFTIGAKYSF
ncbi:outer membrane beta-barrel protein [Telluria aromaticivorans]|uniref:Outer membrane beta-barrel protein n=1 Tax=Telluria aromaticivorans TaxID=2725995 RepID=A0A7Y2P1B6_9BURK|nr:outer membrane beta-barrel protein [Telluria aromaticivorans]NNG25059.1 outer membrane beta-barrel protein [Telluria aromaticivorans]